MVALKGNDIVDVPIAEVGGKNRRVNLDNPLLEVARDVGTCLGV
jgi:hypothetical protein